MKKNLENLRQQFIEAAGNTTQSIGFGRIIGQIFAHLYFCPTPQSLDDLTENLSISKGSASMTVRQLEQWGALRRVWVKGDRKDYYETTDEFGKIIRKAFIELIGQKLETADRLLDSTEEFLKDAADGEKNDEQFLKQRIAKLRSFRQKTQGLLESSLVKMLLK